MIAYNRVLDAFRDYGCLVEEKRSGQAAVQAPDHTSSDRSVSVTAVEGQVLVYCHSDPTGDVLDKIGIQPADLFDDPRGAEYKYGDGRIVRRTPDKRFFQDGNTKGTQLYRAERLNDAQTVFLAEGEKDVHSLESLGVVATSGAGGGKNIKNFDLTPLFGKDVVLVRDNDEIGEAWADILWNELAANVNSIKVVLAYEGKDASDHIAAGYSIDQFVEDGNFATRLARKKLWETWQSSKDAELGDFVKAMESGLKSIKPIEPLDGKIHEWDEVTDEWWAWYEEPEDQRRVVPTPWAKLNNILAGGFQAGRSYLVAARPGVGKSIWLGNSALRAALDGHRTAIFSVEMGRIEVVSRFLAAGADANYGQITKRELDAFNMTRVGEFMDSAHGLPLLIGDTPGLTIDRLWKYAETLCSGPDPIDILLLDYAQLLKGASGQGEQQTNAEISLALKTMSREFNIPVVSAVQVNRDSSKEGKPADLTGLRGSGAYEQDADVVVILHPETEQDPSGATVLTGMIDIIMAKNRTGPLQTISMQARPARARIDE